MVNLRGSDAHNQKKEPNLILRVLQGDKSVMDSGLANWYHWQPELPEAHSACELPHADLPNVAVGMTMCDKICRRQSHSGGGCKISKKYHTMWILLIYWYANFEVATMCY
jgi:hypothetical protein